MTTAKMAAASLLTSWDRIAYLVWQDFVSPYRRTAFSAFWAVVRPILPISAFIFLRMILPSGDEGVHPVVYVGIGTILWFYLSELLMSPVQTFRRKRSLLGTTQFTPIGIIATGAGGVLLDFALRATFALPFVLSYGSIELENVPAGLALIVTSGIVSLGIGIILLPAFLVFPDLYEAATVILRYAIFFSLAVFPLGPETSDLLMNTNPFALIIAETRACLLGNGVPFTLIVTLCALSIGTTYLGFWVTGALGSVLREAAS
ncbi:ABC transporter permease [Parvularcula dongshanensis]|uniref:ABC-type polysaccharide/polyol phosphate export permease n=1 Tax=Parvularcula dongshanensis TaxID=1173995 RepID=A0A840I4J9_9PROT|nr:hypothetical protein [Parvularcula dongshanensis]MBB4658950.1 ABC-type polysaccharide/polyol phosphate export permease [Parvularcula dongshanensis]